MSAPLKGKTIAFAGPFAMNQGKREAVAKALMAGATVSSNFKNADIVFKGDAKLSNPSTAELNARNQGAKVLSASSFLNFVRAGGAERMKKVASAMSTVARKPTAAPIAVRQQNLRAQVTTSRATKAEKKALISALNKKVANAAKKGNRTKSAVPEVSLSAIYADKTDSEIEKMEQEAATFGPMPWQKGSKFQKKQTKLVERKKAKKAALGAKKSKSAAPAPAAAPTVEAPAAPATAETIPAESATITCNQDSNTIMFTPSKGMTVKFSGDFEDFCKMAAELANTSGSINHPLAAAATEAAPVAEAKVEAPAAPEKAAEATPEQEKEASVTDNKDSETMKEVKKLAKKSASSGIDRKKFAAIKKVAGRARKVVTSKSMKSFDPEKVNLKKKTISFTGTFFQLKRIGLQALAAKAGANVTTGLTDIDLVVIGADAAHKKKQAKQLGVPFISEKAFIASCKK